MIDSKLIEDLEYLDSPDLETYIFVLEKFNTVLGEIDSLRNVILSLGNKQVSLLQEKNKLIQEKNVLSGELVSVKNNWYNDQADLKKYKRLYPIEKLDEALEDPVFKGLLLNSKEKLIDHSFREGKKDG